MEKDKMEKGKVEQDNQNLENDVEKVSLSKLVREISKIFENIKEDKKTANEMWKIIPKKQYIRIVILSVIKGISEGFGSPYFTGKTVNSVSKNGLLNPKVFIYGGIRYFIGSISDIISSKTEHEINKMYNQISTDMYMIAYKNFMNNDMDYRKVVGLPSFLHSVGMARSAMFEFMNSLNFITEGISSVVGSGINVFPKHPIIGSLLLVFASLTAIFSAKHAKKIQEYDNQIQDGIRKNSEKAHSFAANTDLFQRTASLKEAIKELETLFNKDKINQNKVDKKRLKAGIVRNIVKGMFQISVFTGVFFVSKNNGDSFGDFMNIQESVERFFISMQRLSRFIPRFKTSFMKFRKAMEIINNAPKIVDKENAIDLTKRLEQKGKIRIPAIEFKNVSFGYDDEKQIFKNFNLKINPKEKIAIVGPSGNGKTTLLNLLDRFYDIKDNCGSVKVDGIDVKDLKLDSLRKNINYISVDNESFFPDSIRKNLTFGMSDVTNEDINFALGCVNLKEMIGHIDDENGVLAGGASFSEGQKRRLNVVRSFFSKAPIVVFDEPTSNIDPPNKDVIVESIKDFCKGKTSIIITHDASVAVEVADRIIVLKDGKIIEDAKTKDLENNKNSKFYEYSVDKKMEKFFEKAGKKR